MGDANLIFPFPSTGTTLSEDAFFSIRIRIGNFVDMGQILQFRRKNAFLPEETTAMGEAYDAALRSLNEDAKSELFVRELVAKRIVQAASIGEEDRERLRKTGLLGFSRPRCRTG